jgi:hypothetical protein
LDQAGLLLNIYTGVTDIYQGREWLDTAGREGIGREIYHRGLSLAFAAFQEAEKCAAEDLAALILVEQTYLAQELAYCVQTDRKAANSLKNALDAFDEGLLALKVAESGLPYCSAEQTYSHRKNCRSAGMPKDAFHYACAGHIKRLDGILHTPGINFTEKNLLKQRLSNVATAQSVYVEKQKKALEVCCASRTE